MGRLLIKQNSFWLYVFHGFFEIGHHISLMRDSLGIKRGAPVRWIYTRWDSIVVYEWSYNPLQMAL